MKEIDFRRDLLPHKDKLYRLALRITLQRPEAEDVVQETLIRAWERREELGNVESVEAYLLTVCRNLAIDRREKKDNQNVSLGEEEMELPASDISPQERPEYEERLRRVHELFSKLPERQRTVMQLRDIEGLSYRETAQAMGITEDVVRVTLHRARAAIRQAFEKEEYYGL